MKYILLFLLSIVTPAILGILGLVLVLVSYSVWIVTYLLLEIIFMLLDIAHEKSEAG